MWIGLYAISLSCDNAVRPKRFWHTFVIFESNFALKDVYASLGWFGKNKHVDFHNLRSQSANSDFPFTLYVLARHCTTGGGGGGGGGGYAAAIFPWGEYGS